MNIGGREIAWEMIPNSQFTEIVRKAVGRDFLKTKGIRFRTSNLVLNVSYGNEDFDPLLMEKFGVCLPEEKAPHLTFIPDHGRLGFKLPFEHFGYVSETQKRALVFASSFGIFKSVISGYASMLLDDQGYVPAHASALSVNGLGLLLIGGSSAGKTTTLLNLVDWATHSGRAFRILTDDWAVVIKRGGSYVAESFDPSVSLRKKNLDENPHLYFAHHKEIQRAIAEQKKISRSPDALFGNRIGVERMQIDAVILLLPQEGEKNLFRVNSNGFAKATVDAAYHYPYVSADQIRRHVGFWKELTKEIPTFSFFTRGRGGVFQPIDALKELVYEK